MTPSTPQHQSESRTTAQRTVIIFLALTIALCLIPYYLILSADSSKAIPDLAIVGIMWAPGLAALATRLLVQRNLGNFGWRLGAPRYLVVSYLLPAVGCFL